MLISLRGFPFKDVSQNCGASFSVVVVSEEFQGVSLLERQRQVNSLLSEEMKTIQ